MLGIQHGRCVNQSDNTSAKEACDLYLLTEQLQWYKSWLALAVVCCLFTEDFSFHCTASDKESVGVPYLPQQK